MKLQNLAHVFLLEKEKIVGKPINIKKTKKAKKTPERVFFTVKTNFRI